MTRVHEYVGWLVPALFLIVALWALVSFIRNKMPAETFWRILGAAQVVLAVQVLIGAILFLFLGRRGPEWRHYTYGLLFPLFLLVMGHRAARRYEDISWIIFGVVAFLNFGLTVQALRTGFDVAG